MTLRRTGPPARRTRLQRGKPPARHTRLRPVSERKPSKPGRYSRREQRAIRSRAAEPWQGTACWLAIPGLCTGAGEHWHELVGSAQGGSRVDPRNLCWACDSCNGRLEGLAERYVVGWKIRPQQSVRGDGGRVPSFPHPLALASRRCAI